MGRNSSGPGSATPALLTSPCNGPAADTCSPAARTDASSVRSSRSTLTASEWSRRSACSSSSVRTAAQTWNPRPANSATDARPMPVEAPVTTTDLDVMALSPIWYSIPLDSSYPMLGDQLLTAASDRVAADLAPLGTCLADALAVTRAGLLVLTGRIAERSHRLPVRERLLGERAELRAGNLAKERGYVEAGIDVLQRMTPHPQPHSSPRTWPRPATQQATPKPWPPGRTFQPSSTRRSACAARKPGCGYATCAYSLIRPPRIGLRSTRAASTWPECSGGFGGCWPSVRCRR